MNDHVDQTAMDGPGRIALVVNRYPVTSQTFIRTQFEGLRSAGTDCRIVDKAIDPRGMRQPRIPGVERLPVLSRRTYPAELMVRGALSAVRRPGRSLANARAARRIQRPLVASHWLTLGRLAALRPRVVHYAFASYALGEEHLAAALGVPLVVSCRGYDLTHVAGGSSDVYRRLWAATDLVHFRSADLRDLAIRLGFDPSRPHRVTPPGIDASYFAPEPDGANPQRAQGPHVVASVGRLVAKKGHEVALQVIARLRDNGFDLRYDLVGAGDREADLRRLAHHLGIGDVTRFLGELTPAAVRDTLRDADVLLHPSWQEGFGVSVLEAQALELPVVCSDAEGLAENVADGETGYVLPAGDVAAMTERVGAILSDAGLARRLGRAGRARVLRSFTVEREIDAYLDSYRFVLAQRDNPTRVPLTGHE
jgi:glycosyltransferase involved in cell wall biosynthesis